MTPDSLISWRKRLKLSQAKAAEALGVSRRAYGQYEAGVRQTADGPEPVEVPKLVALGCAALALGLPPHP